MVDTVKRVQRVSFRHALRTMREADSLALMFNALYRVLTIAEFKTAELVKDMNSVRKHFYFTEDEVKKIRHRSLLIDFAMEKVPKRGQCHVSVNKGSFTLEFRPVVVYGDDHNAKYEIQLTAVLIETHTGFYLK